MMRHAVAASALVALAIWSTPLMAGAQAAHIHVVRPGETLASIAQAYYGDPRRENVLVAENGLTTQGGAAIVVGMRLVIPRVAYHRVQTGETWNQITERYYGDARRAFMLIEANNGTAGGQPDEGAELLVPYPLRHVANQNDSLRRVGLLYFGNEGPETIRRLRRFNNLRGLRLARGQVVLAPVADLLLSEEGRRLIEERTGDTVDIGDTRALQQRIDEQLPELHEHVRRGRFTEVISLGNRLLGAGELTGNQVVTIQRDLATAYVALDRVDMAVEAFRTMLTRQPDLEMDVTRTSPTVLRPFRQAREELERESQERAAAAPDAADAGAPDD